MDISVILPIFNERENLVPLLDEIDEALGATGKTYEILAVDDGSDDGSTELLKKLAGERPRLRAIFFRKNSGQAAAFDAGFRNASGEVVVTMDADRQNDTTDLPSNPDTGELASGWCYIDVSSSPPVGSPELVEACPDDARRRLRFVGTDTPKAGSTLFLACAL